MTQRKKHLFLAAALAGLTLSACGISRDIEPMLTITQGIYGQTTSLDDVGDNDPEYKPMAIDVFAAGQSAPLKSVTSGARGFYEVALEPGTYRLCTSFGRCTRTDVTVAANARVRVDYEFSVGPGWSQ